MSAPQASKGDLITTIAKENDVRVLHPVEALAQALEASGAQQSARLAQVGSAPKAATLDAVALARALENAQVRIAGQAGRMRAADHQFQQPLHQFQRHLLQFRRHQHQFQ